MSKGKNKKIQWCEQEDLFLINFVQKLGTKKWSKMAQELFQAFGDAKKTGKHCRQRWINHLDPSIVKKQWSKQQEEILFQAHKKYGSRWTIISESLKGRSDNSIKNHFYSLIRKYLRRINKVLGNKNSTLKVKKIKPSTLSKVFSLNEQEQQAEEQLSDCLNISNSSQEYFRYRQLIYNLINLSRNKLSQNINLISEQDRQMFEKLIEQIGKINQIYEKETQELRRQKQMDQSQYSQYSQPACIRRNSKKRQDHKTKKKQTPQFKSIYQIKLRKNQSTPIKNQINICDGVVQNIDYCQFDAPQIFADKEQSGKSLDFPNEQVSQITMNVSNPKDQFDFHLQLNDVPDFNLMGSSQWIQMTPSFAFTPNINKNPLVFGNLQSNLKQFNFNSIAENIKSEIKQNTNKLNNQLDQMRQEQVNQLFFSPSLLQQF